MKKLRYAYRIYELGFYGQSNKLTWNLLANQIVSVNVVKLLTVCYSCFHVGCQQQCVSLITSWKVLQSDRFRSGWLSADQTVSRSHDLLTFPMKITQSSQWKAAISVIMQPGKIGHTSMLNDECMSACGFLGIFMTQKVLGSLSEVSRDSTKPTKIIPEQEKNFLK